jgi:hypothetical protein
VPFSSGFCFFLPLGSKYYPNNLLAGIQIYSSFEVRDEVPRPYKPTAKTKDVCNMSYSEVSG